MADEITTTDPQGQSTTITQDPPGQGGQSTDPGAQDSSTQNVDNLPEKFKGKSAVDIAKAYKELEQLHGKNSKEVNEVRGQLEKWQKLGKILEADPELYKQVEGAIDKFSGKKTDTTENDQVSEDLKDTKLATENRIINDFERGYNIHQLAPEKRTELQTKIGQELAEMLDPGGKRTVKEVLDSIPLTRLPNYLEKAYKLATLNDREERARVEGLAEARQNNEASFGNIPSSSLKQNAQLTEDEKKVAKKMNISEENYLKNKLALQE